MMIIALLHFRGWVGLRFFTPVHEPTNFRIFSVIHFENLHRQEKLVRRAIPFWKQNVN